MEATNKIFEKSLIHKNFISKIKDKNITTVSFDIFDTLFFRKCGSPSSIFKIIGNKPQVKEYYLDSSTYENYRKAAEKKAIKNKTSEEINIKEIYDNYPGEPAFTEMLKQLEITVEKENLELNKQIYNWIRLAKEHNKKIILISDMYLTEKEIDFVALNKIPELELIDKTYVSSDVGYRKSSGNLYQYVLKDLNITSENLLHIGDNLSSDINIAQAMGINTLYYNYGKDFQETLENEKLYLKEDFIEKDQLRLLTYLANPYQNKEEAFFYQVGSTLFGPLLYEFSMWLHKISKIHNLEKLNFFMREGYTFNKVYKLLFPDSLTQTVKISRDSTNFLEANPDDLGQINFNKSREFKVKDLYDLYKIKITDKKITSVKEELFNGNSLQDYILRDLENRKTEIIKKIANQKIALDRYFNKIELKPSSTFIDFGGGGTVFERLNSYYLKSKEHKVDILFFAQPKAFNSKSNITTLPFLPYNEKTAKAIDSIHRTPYFIETLLNGFNFSASEYKKTINSYEIIERPLDFYDDRLKQNLNALLEGILNFVIIAKENNVKKYCRNYLALLLARLINLPTKLETTTFGNFIYDEGKGSNDLFPLVDSKIQENIDLNKLYLEYINNPFKHKNKFPWLEGFLTKKSPSLLKSYYGITASQNQVAINNILERIDREKIKEVSIYAAGELFEMLLPHLVDRKVIIKNVYDLRAKIKPFNFLGYPVQDIDKAEQSKNSTIIIASVVFYTDIKELILKTNTSLRII